MKKYEASELKSIYFDIDGKIMDGYDAGDVMDNPWSDLLQDQSSGEINPQL